MVAAATATVSATAASVSMVAMQDRQDVSSQFNHQVYITLPRSPRLSPSADSVRLLPLVEGPRDRTRAPATPDLLPASIHCACACVRVCSRARVRACVRACVPVSQSTSETTAYLRAVSALENCGSARALEISLRVKNSDGVVFSRDLGFIYRAITVHEKFRERANTATVLN
jgi:hypothetical protein